MTNLLDVHLAFTYHLTSLRIRNTERVPTKATHWPDEDNVQVGFSADKGDVRAGFRVDKDDGRVATKTTGGWRQRRCADKDSTHKVRWGPSWGCQAGHGMGA
ncbi:hypothetical protein B0H14DRAFT_3510282 [Mycena olivaceomarginata]|nr:hypothetical protein B0H14DRAFT_3510282 [Mycena olivaceomarginata]